MILSIVLSVALFATLVTVMCVLGVPTHYSLLMAAAAICWLYCGIESEGCNERED